MGDFHPQGQDHAQSLQEDGLVLRRPGYAATFDFFAIARWQDDIDEADLAKFIKKPSWLISQACFVAHLSQRFP